MPEEIIETEEQNEGVRNLRAKLKEEAEARRQAEERIAAFEARERESSLKQAFVENGLPVQSASLYPQDGEVSGAAVAAWASTHGIVPAASAPEPQLSRQEEILARHNQMISQAFARPSETSSLEDLAREMYAKTEKAYNSNYQPTAKELEESSEDARTVNRINAASERDVQMGRMPGPKGGVVEFGGLIAPPDYANRVLQATLND